MNLAEMLAAADAATQNVEVNTDFELITPGDYNVAVTGAELKESKRTNYANPDEHGQYLKIECTITGPSFVGRKVWFNNNILVYPKDASAEALKSSQTAMAMAGKERSIMYASIGKNGIQKAEELIGATFVASVIVEKGTNGYKDRNGIKSVKPCNGAPAPVVATPVATPAATVTIAPKAKMPWEK